MEWFFPSLKNSLFPAKSTGAIAESQPSTPAVPPEQDAILPTEIPDVEFQPVVAEEDENPIAKPSHQLRRRSSLSDLDGLLRKENQRIARTSDLLTIGEYGAADKRHGRLWSLLLDGPPNSSCESGGYPLSCGGAKGGSIGDMINLKLYGSNRSLVSGTSSIAEAVPLETIQRKKATPSVVSCSSSNRVVVDCSSDDVFHHHHHQQRHPQDDASAISQNDTVMDGRDGSNDELVDPPEALPYGEDVIIIEEDEEGSDDVVRELVTTRHAKQIRTPSITERAERLSQLIRKRQCRCSRYADDVAVKISTLFRLFFFFLSGHAFGRRYIYILGATSTASPPCPCAAEIDSAPPDDLEYHPPDGSPRPISWMRS